MYNTKVNLSIIVPGAVLFSERDAARKGIKKVQAVDEEGKPIFLKNGKPKMQLLFSKLYFDEVEVWDGTKKITIYLRKTAPAVKRIEISKESYDYLRSIESNCLVSRMTMEKNPRFLSKSEKAAIKRWKEMSEEERMLTHFKQICAENNGRYFTYKTIDDE